MVEYKCLRENLSKEEERYIMERNKDVGSL